MVGNFHERKMLELVRASVLKWGMILVTFKLAVDVKSEDNMEVTVVSGAQERHCQTTCNIQTFDKTVILNCSGVAIQSEGFAVMDKSVNILDVSNTGLTSLAVLGNGDVLENLLFLNASHNEMKHINEEIFKKMPYLEKLDLSFNLIGQIPDDIFMLLQELKFLDLSNNKLKYLPNRLPLMEWFDISNNEISSISETFSSVLYPQTVFLIGQNPFRCTCENLWLKDLLETRKYLLKFVQNLDRKKFIPVCSLPENLAGKSWDSLDDKDFKCTGSETEINIESSNEKLSSNIKDIKVTVSEIGHNSVILKWNGNSDSDGKVLEITFHKFGKKEELKQVILPFSASGYRLKSLEPESPYIICFKALLGKDSYLLGCEEIFTRKIPHQSSLYFWRNCLQFVNDYTGHLIALLILFVTAIFIIQRREIKKDEKY